LKDWVPANDMLGYPLRYEKLGDFGVPRQNAFG